jgi:tetratricopeptide (TPR) repeat protein
MKGEGFKSESERQTYIKSLGDPFKHPMFARTSEDLVGSPYVPALRALQEEDKSNVELCEMYKSEGNEFMKQSPQALLKQEKEGTRSKDGSVGSTWQKKGKKNMDEAYDRYSYALTFLDKADKARVSRLAKGKREGEVNSSNSSNNNGGEDDSLFSLYAGAVGGKEKESIQAEEEEEERDRAVDLPLLRSQLLANRALASLNINNFGYCRDDCVAALTLQPSNMKAHYRLCKALEGLKKFDKCINACNLALSIDPSSVDILKLRDSCQSTLDVIAKEVS